MKKWMFAVLLVGTMAFAGDAIDIQLRHNSDRERQTKAELEKVLGEYDLHKYTFTNKVVIEDRAIAHSFPEITLNTRFLGSDDELLSSYIHEQLHWYLRDHHVQTEDAIAQLRKFYPRVPVGGAEGADSEYSTYGHLIDCYLEMQADRELIGTERTMKVVQNKGHYTWIYKTDIDDEARIKAIVDGERLEIK